MPYVLHPSGYCAYFQAGSAANLQPAAPCPLCGYVVGHHVNCLNFKPPTDKGKSSRPKLFNAAAVLWAKSPRANFYTFTLPSIAAGRYQRSIDCPETGDIAIAEKFSKLLEAWAVRVKRQGRKLSYCWVSERQESRRKKYGGVGELHYHMIANEVIKNDQDKVIDRGLLDSLQCLWCDHLGVGMAGNCVDVKPVPQWTRSIPAYLAKYLGKGKQLPILSRRFAATRDLTALAPVQLIYRPDLPIETTASWTTEDGYTVTVDYFNTRCTLEQYGQHMLDSKDLKRRISEDDSPAVAASRQRRIARQIAQNYPHTGLSYSA